MVARGLPNKLIARELSISEKTVKAHLTSVFRTIGVTDRTQAALWAERNGVIGWVLGPKSDCALPAGGTIDVMANSAVSGPSCARRPARAHRARRRPRTTTETTSRVRSARAAPEHRAASRPHARRRPAAGRARRTDAAPRERLERRDGPRAAARPPRSAADRSSSGSFSLRRTIPDWPGRDTVTVRATGPGGEICRATATVRGD